MNKPDYLPAMFKRGKDGNWQVMAVFDNIVTAQECRAELEDSKKIFIVPIARNCVLDSEETISLLDNMEEDIEHC